MAGFGFKIVRVDPAGKLDLFELYGLLFFARFFFAFVAVKAELAVIHDLANGGRCLRRHHNKIHSVVVGSFQRLFGADDSEGLAVRSDQTDFRCGNILVEQGLFVLRANSSTPHSIKKFRTKTESPRGKTFPFWGKLFINPFALRGG